MTKTKQFETSLSELETIVKQLEKGELTLDESLKQFEKGMTLANTCQTILKTAEQTIETVTNAKQSDELNPNRGREGADNQSSKHHK